MAEGKNNQILLAARPEGAPRDNDFRIVETPIPAPGPGEMLLRTVYLGLDPIIRLRMNAGSYWPAFELGKPLTGRAVCAVETSNLPGFAPGDLVVTQADWADYMISNGTGPGGAPLPKLDPARGPVTAPLHVLGVTGLTAYVGLLEIGRPQAGETVVVSGASGAVGSMAGQIAKIKGCRVVGIAGGPEKCRYVTDELGFDAAIDYKAENVAKALHAHCPNGIDVYFDNVGGEILDACLAQINMRARIVICGAISQYNSTTGIKGPANYLSLLVHRARMEGMIVFDYAARYPEAQKEMAGWLKAGKLRHREDVVDGLETFPDTLNRLFTGENFGKLVLKV